MDPDRAASFAENLLDEEKLKDLTAADGTLPGGGCTCLRDRGASELPLAFVLLHVPHATCLSHGRGIITSCIPSSPPLTLDTGMTPEMLSKLVSNPELMVLMQNPKLQEIMKKVNGTNIRSERYQIS